MFFRHCCERKNQLWLDSRDLDMNYLKHWPDKLCDFSFLSLTICEVSVEPSPGRVCWKRRLSDGPIMMGVHTAVFQWKIWGERHREPSLPPSPPPYPLFLGTVGYANVWQDTWFSRWFPTHRILLVTGVKLQFWMRHKARIRLYYRIHENTTSYYLTAKSRERNKRWCEIWFLQVLRAVSHKYLQQLRTRHINNTVESRFLGPIFVSLNG